MNHPATLEGFCVWLGRTSGQASILILLVLAVQWVFRKRLAPQWRYNLWLLVVARLVLPALPESQFSLFNLQGLQRISPSHTATALNPRGEETKAIELASVKTEPPVSSVPSSVLPSLPENADPKTSRPAKSESGPSLTKPAQPHLNVKLLLAWGWLAGVLIFAARLTWDYWRLMRGLRRAGPVTTPNVLESLNDVRLEMGVRQSLELIETPLIQSPALVGFWRVRLLLPCGLLEKFSAQELRFVLLHELAHLKRRDVAMNWVMIFLQVLHWFNPFVWLGFRQMRADREMACDALALAHAREDENKPYAQTILRLLEDLVRPVPLPGLVGILEDGSQMKQRIAMVLRFKPTHRSHLLAVMLLLGLGATTLTDAQTKPAFNLTNSTTRIFATQQNVRVSSPDYGGIAISAAKFSGVITCEGFDRNSDKPVVQEKREFFAAVAGTSWFIRTIGHPPEDYEESGSDGKRAYHVISLQSLTADARTHGDGITNYFQASILSENVPVNGIMNHTPLWLAFASGSVLQNRNEGNVEMLFKGMHIHETVPQDYKIPSRWELIGGQLKFPRRFSQTEGRSYFVWAVPQDVQVVPPENQTYEPPWDLGFTSCVYHVTQTMEAAGQLWPKTASLRYYTLLSQKSPAKLFNGMTYQITVTNLEFGTIPNYIPQLPPGATAMVADNRFMHDPNSRTAFSYLTSTNRWLTDAEVRDRPEYAESLLRLGKLRQYSERVRAAQVEDALREPKTSSTNTELAASVAAKENAEKFGIKVLGLFAMYGEPPRAWLSVRQPAGTELEEWVNIGKKNLGIELVRIDAANQSVEVRCGESPELIRLELNHEVSRGHPLSVSQPGETDFIFGGLPSEAVMEIYVNLTKRMVLQRGDFASIGITLDSDRTLSAEETEQKLVTGFAEHGEALIAHRDKFVLVVPTRERERFLQTATAQPLPADPSDDSRMHVLNFKNIPLNQICDLYAKAMGRTNTFVSPAPPLSCTTRLVTSQTLSHTESLYVYGAWLALNDVAVETVGDHEMRFIYPNRQAWETFQAKDEYVQPGGKTREARAQSPPPRTAREIMFQVQGVLKEIKPDRKTAIIQHGEIPGYMPAMTMPFVAKDTSELAELKAGDAVWFNLYVNRTNGAIEHVQKVPAFRIVQAVQPLNEGDLIPDYSFTNELGKTVQLGDFKGQAVALTFIEVNCPFPLFCLKMTSNFSEAYQKLTTDPSAPKNWNLLSLSFDPEQDTTKELLRYAKKQDYDPKKWSFLTGAQTNIEIVTQQAGMRIFNDGLFSRDQHMGLNHNLRTVVINAEGKIQKILIGNDWSVDELVAEITKAASVQ